MRGLLVLTGSLALLAGCSGDQLTRTFGLARDSPDEHTVTTLAPLSIPPDYNLRPPSPGAPHPQEQSEQDAQSASADQGFIDKLLYWRKPDTNVGETPIIQPNKTGWFTNLQ